MTRQISIEKARPEHLREIVAIVNAGATSVRAGKDFAVWQDYRPAFDALREAPEADIYVALEETGEVIGTFQIHFLKGFAFQGRPRVQLESVHVRPDRRGTGIGRLMMEKAEALAMEAGACMIQLTSNREREGSHHFYRRLGYDPSHVGYKKMFV